MAQQPPKLTHYLPSRTWHCLAIDENGGIWALVDTNSPLTVTWKKLRVQADDPGLDSHSHLNTGGPPH